MTTHGISKEMREGRVSEQIQSNDSLAETLKASKLNKMKPNNLEAAKKVVISLPETSNNMQWLCNIKRNQNICLKCIDNMPTEIIYNHLFIYLDDVDIFNLGIAINGRIRHISESYLSNPLHITDQTCKFVIIVFVPCCRMV